MNNSLVEDINNIIISDTTSTGVVNNNESEELIRTGINDTDPILFIDMSYYIFYRFFALCSWWKRAFPEEPLDIENILDNNIFIDKYHNLFIENIKKITTKYRIQNANIIFAKDCRRNDIWRNELFPEYKKSRKVNNEVGEFFIHTYKNIIHKYNYISVDKCEADDIIGVLTKELYKDNKIYIITVGTPIKNLIREAKIHQIPSVMQTGQREGMITMEKSIEELVGRGDISNAEKNS